MEDQTPTNKPVTPSKSSHNSEDSIINRKIERRGLPSSFSSNLVRPRVSPPRNNEAVVSSGKSVKSIVNFFEASKSNTTSGISGDGGSSKGKPPSNNASRVSATTATSTSHAPLMQHGYSSLGNAPDVEEYSLTLLKYRQYFTEQPLGRCLDGQHQSAQAPSDQQLLVSKKRQAPHKDTNLDAQPTGEEASTSVDRPKDAQALIHRNSQEVAAFWHHIRSYLWIPDEELEELEYDQKAQLSVSTKSSSPYTEAFPLLDDLGLSPPMPPPGSMRDSQRANSSGSQRSLDEQRRYLQSTEKQLSDIDAYISRNNHSNGPSPTSPDFPVPAPLVSPTLATHGPNLRSLSQGSHEPVRCISCSKIRLSPGESSYRGSGHSSQGRPPQRPPMNLSRGNSGRVVEPPVLGEEDQKRNFF